MLSFTPVHLYTGLRIRNIQSFKDSLYLETAHFLKLSIQFNSKSAYKDRPWPTCSTMLAHATLKLILNVWWIQIYTLLKKWAFLKRQSYTQILFTKHMYNVYHFVRCPSIKHLICFSLNICVILLDKQCKPRSGCSFRSILDQGLLCCLVPFHPYTSPGIKRDSLKF